MLNTKSAGYSLLELLVVVSIMGIVFAGGFASYRDYQRRQNLESVARLIRGDLRLAQEYAIAGKKPADAGNPCLTNQLDGYLFDRENDTEYKIVAQCGGNSSTFDIKTVDLSEVFPTIRLSSFQPANRLLFNILGRGTNCQPPSCPSLTTITIYEEGATCPGTQCKDIVVTASGEIR